MKREQIAALITTLLIGVLVIAVAIRNSGGRSAGGGSTDEDVKPSRVVFDLFQFAKAGDTEGYLDCFDDRLRESVETSARDMGEAAFQAQIQDIGEKVKGVSVSE